VNVVDFLDRGALIAPHRPAFVGADGTGAISYSEVEDFTHRFAAALHRDGVDRGTPVAVLSHNAPMVLPCVLGVFRAGCSWVALNARATPADLIALLDLVEARWLFASAALADVVEQVTRSVSGLERVVAIDAEIDGADHLDSWLPAHGRVASTDFGADAVAGYFGTGGTTGRPKAVAVPHRAIATMVHGFNSHMPEEAPVNLVAAPLTHAAGVATFPVLSLGGTSVVHDGVAPAAVLESISHHGVTRLFLPPTAIYALLDHPDVDGADFSTLRYFLYGAAPMSADRLVEAMEVFGPVMAQCYGQTEAAMICTYLGPDEHDAAMRDPALRHRLTSCGRPSLVASVAVLDDAGTPVPRGVRGEVHVRTALQMLGYHADAEATEAVRRPGGWQATGDIGMIDDDGYVYLLDRTRDLIITGGFNVFPSEVEQVVWGHPAVADCAVIGLPHDKWGEQVTAFVELKSSAGDPDLVAREIMASCRERLGSVKAPKEIRFSALPRSPVGKVLKRALRDEHWTGSGRLI
jgi:acyl-CoA synthetase (AMP-forming)/AMP-acid ligase II